MAAALYRDCDDGDGLNGAAVTWRVGRPFAFTHFHNNDIFVKIPKSPIRARPLIRHQAAYAAHNDPAAFAINKIALILAWNGPFYPIYLLLLIGRDALPWSLLTLLVTPLFYAIPWMMRRSSVVGRMALPLAGAANTIWCLKLFGPESGVGLFLYPCIVLAAFLFRPRERWLMLPVLGVSLLLEFLPRSVLGSPILILTPNESSLLTALNAGSVAVLLALITLQFVDVARSAERHGGKTP